MKSKIVFAALLLLCFSNVLGGVFTPPKADPWYYEMKSGGINMPDKFAHYYRSYIGVKLVDWKIVALGNIAYEMYDGKRGVGYSWKDNVADFAGLISSKWLSNEKMTMYLDWKKENKCLILMVNLVY